MLVGQPYNKDLDCMIVAQVFHISAGRCEPFDIASKGFTLSLDGCQQASHISGLPLVG